MNTKKTLLALAIVAFTAAGTAAAAGVEYEAVELPVDETLNVSDGEDVRVSAENVTNESGDNVDIGVTANATNSTDTEVLHDDTLSTGSNTTVSETYDVNGSMWDNVTVSVGDDYDTGNDTYTAANLTIKTVDEGGLVGGGSDTTLVVGVVVALAVVAYVARKEE